MPMDAESMLSLMANRQVDRFLRAKAPIRRKLGNNVDLYSFQQRMLGTFLLSPSMGPVLFEAGRKVALQATTQVITMVSKGSDYHSFANARDLEEARLSTEFKLLQHVYQSTGCGILQLSQYEKDEQIVFQVDECAECFALTDIGRAICYYTGGDLSGSMEAILGRSVGVVESKCVVKGDKFCEFRANPMKDVGEWQH